jgi:hypothetical protein
VKDLFEGYSSALGNPVDVPTMALILSAAEAVTIAETARADNIAGKADLNAVVRAEGMARALRRVGLSKVAVTKPAAPSIHDIAQRYASAPATPVPVGDGA